MDKQMIEEMAEIIFNSKYKNDYISPLKGANELYNAGYRKIPENSVVLKMEEYEWLTCCFGKFEEIMNDIKEQSRNETAEKFEEEVDKWKRKAIFYYNLVKECGVHCVADDEIAKEFTEGDK